MIHYSCIGATGYVCGEVLRMMVNHHEGELVNVLDTYGVGDAISTHHPALRGFYDQVIMDLTEENVRETAKKSDVIMIQVPSGDVAKWAEIVLAEDCAIIDIGADIRFRDVDVWEKWYGQKHPDAKMTHDAVYCIPEVMRDLAKGKKLIANPGCYPTASTLGLQPMLKAGHIVDNTIVIDAKSGYTGAGRRPALNKLLTEAENNFCAYALGGGHRHTPEIEQNIAYITGKDLMKPETWQYINFQPHLLPQVRGIEVTIYATCDRDFTNEEVYELYKDFYKNEPFVKVFPASLPVQTKWVYGTNFCEMTPTFDARLVAKSIAGSMLFKAAVFGRDANWGRIMAAAGYSGADVDPTRADCIIKSAAGEVQVMKDGFGADFSEELAKKVLTEHDITVIVRFYQGDGEAKAWGCDLTYDYVKINGDYRT